MRWIDKNCKKELKQQGTENVNDVAQGRRAKYERSLICSQSSAERLLKLKNEICKLHISTLFLKQKKWKIISISSVFFFLCLCTIYRTIYLTLHIGLNINFADLFTLYTWRFVFIFVNFNTFSKVPTRITRPSVRHNNNASPCYVIECIIMFNVFDVDSHKSFMIKHFIRLCVLRTLTGNTYKWTTFGLNFVSRVVNFL